MKANTLLGGAMAVLLGIAVLGASCTKSPDGPGGSSSHLDVYLTDAPGDYLGVWIDVQKIMVQAPTDSAGAWTDVPLVHAGMYNLLDFRNGADTVLGGVDLAAGKVSQIRLVLGDDNYLILKDSTKVPLTTPSAQESGLKLNIDADLKAGIPYALVLDFDASRSIVEAGHSGKYLLKPVIRTFAKAAGGSIEGVVLPDSAHPHVLAIMNTDTMGANPDDEGNYKFWGVPAGSYSLVFQADTTTGFQSQTLDHVTVSTGEVTKADTVVLTR
jgi:hypothetical protein